MALRHKHVTLIARSLFKVRTEAAREYANEPELLVVAYGTVDSLGVLLATVLELEMTNFDAEKFLFRFGYGKGVEGEGAESLPGSEVSKLKQIDVDSATGRNK